jgi:alginate O-acetyltransferase complex protein AlgI
MTAYERMLIVSGFLYVASKAAMFRPLPKGRAAAFVALWPGMDPRPFALTRPPEERALAAAGAVRAALGLAIDVFLRFVAFFFIFHFGLCDVLAGLWRRAGVPVERICDNPQLSKSLAEFWGRRWNMAFHALARDVVYRPVARRWGPAWGVMAAFAFSGVAHDLVISLPVGAGYGLPTLYFLLHGALLLSERRWGLRGRLWTAFWVLAPLPALFHPWFVRAVVLPLV